MSTSGVVLVLLVAGLMTIALVIVWRKAGAGETGKRRLLYLLSMVGLSYGLLALIVPALGAAGGLSLLPATFEWPVGVASGVVRDAAGRYVVPLTPCGRVQVYDQNRKFLVGWPVEADGGLFKLRVAGEGLFDIFTARGKRHFVFRPDGKLAKDNGSYSAAYSEVAPESKLTERFDTPFLLRPFADPNTAWTLTVVSAFGLLALNRMKPKTASEPDQERSDTGAKPPPDAPSPF